MSATGVLLDMGDGRQLEVRVSGPEGALPLLFLHATPGAAAPVRAIERAVHERGMRMVTFARAGYGASTRLRGRRVVDVVPDAAAVLEHLGAGSCLVAGWSGGGPHALACAARLGGVRAALVIAGVAPFDADELDWMEGMAQDNVEHFEAALEGEAALRPYLEAARDRLVSVPADGVRASLGPLLAEADKAVVTGEFAEDMASTYHEGLRGGADGWVDDNLALVSGWGFEVEEVSPPTVLWQGDRDLMVPFSHGQWLAARAPGARVYLEAGEGHLSFVAGTIGRLLDALVEVAA